jgi:hypothetical protein
MMPLLAIVRVRRAGGGFTFWAPLFLLWLVLVPVAVLAAPFFLVVCLTRGLSPVGAAAGVLGVLCALAGSQIGVDAPDASVRIRLI